MGQVVPKCGARGTVTYRMTSPEALHQDLVDFRVSHLDLTYFGQQRQNRNDSKKLKSVSQDGKGDASLDQKIIFHKTPHLKKSTNVCLDNCALFSYFDVDVLWSSVLSCGSRSHMMSAN
ncbi:hypothetical protein STEG23_011371 [Scotinomys teguina]